MALRITVFCLLCATIISLTFVWRIWQYLHTPVLMQQPYFDLAIKSGTPFNTTLKQLSQLGVIERPLIFKLYARLSGVSSKIQAGEYRFAVSATPLDILYGLTDGGHARQYPFPIIAGWTFPQLREKIEGFSDVLDVRTAGLSEQTIMARIGRAGVHPEGRFLPDTYYLTRGSSDIELLMRAYVATEKYLQQAWEGRSDGVVVLKNPEEALILASMVEKEAGTIEEMNLIAAVFISRLYLKMRLQSDPTVIYGLGDQYRDTIYRSDLKKVTPYNTYVNFGLTPTPIAMPSMEAIDAVLHPASSSALYFVARGDGTHVFSNSLSEHNRAVQKYQR